MLPEPPDAVAAKTGGVPATPEFLGPVTIEVLMTNTIEIQRTDGCEDQEQAFDYVEEVTRSNLSVMGCEVLEVKHIKDD